MFSTILTGVALVVGQTGPVTPPQPAPWTRVTVITTAGPQAAASEGPAPNESAPKEASGSSGNNGKEANGSSGDNGKESDDAWKNAPAGFCKRFLREYPTLVEYFPRCFGKEVKKEEKTEEPEAPRRALPPPFPSPPYPSGEYQGYPLVGVPPDSNVYPLMKAIYGTPWGEEIKESRIKAYGWFNASGNWSTSRNTNMPDSYWIVPNRFELDQFVFRVERQVDSVQTDHIDVGFRSTVLYGIDYRYMTAGGWFSEQLLKHNFLYGADPTEQYIDVYVPGIAQGMILRVGRWIACPDIETQFAPDNYIGTHSLLFTFDTYTQTGVMATVMLNKQWTVQACIHSGTDMAPWYQGAIATGMFGVRWVAADNNDSIYTVLNAINDAKFRHFTEDGQPSGHDNFNYIVTTWQHRFCKEVHTKTEAYYMWQFDAVVGGTPSLGPVKPFGGGGGIGAPIPGNAAAFGVLNYTEFMLTKKDYFTVRNEWWNDEKGERSGFATNYSSHTIGLCHNFTDLFQVRPEIGYYHSYNTAAFDGGLRKNMVLYGFDMTLRF